MGGETNDVAPVLNVIQLPAVRVALTVKASEHTDSYKVKMASTINHTP
jgi:hypothetical protein